MSLIPTNVSTWSKHGLDMVKKYETPWICPSDPVDALFKISKLYITQK